MADDVQELPTQTHCVIQMARATTPISGKLHSIEGRPLLLDKPSFPPHAVGYPDTQLLSRVASLVTHAKNPHSIGLCLGRPEALGEGTTVFAVPTDIPSEATWVNDSATPGLVGVFVSSRSGKPVFDDLVREAEADLTSLFPNYPTSARWWFRDWGTGNSPWADTSKPLRAVLVLQVSSIAQWNSNGLTFDSARALDYSRIPAGEVLTPHAPDKQGFPLEETPVQSYFVEGGFFNLPEAVPAPAPLAEVPESVDLARINTLSAAEAALLYVSFGWPVLRVWPIVDGRCSCPNNCANAGKHPIGGTNGFSTDEDEVLRWWKETPTAGVALATGVTFNVLDIDVGDDRNGFTSLVADTGFSADQLTQAGAIRQTTPSGGTHLLFARDAMGLIQFKNFTRKGSAGGLDMRSTNGIIVCPPSVGANGVTYQWLGGSPTEMPLMPPELETACIQWSSTVNTIIKETSPMPNWDTPEVESSVSNDRVSEVLGKHYQFLLDGVAEDRSAALFSVCIRLFRARFSAEQIMWVLCHSAGYQVAADHRSGSPDTWLWEYCVKKAQLSAPPTADEMFAPIETAKNQKKEEGSTVLEFLKTQSGGALTEVATTRVEVVPGGGETSRVKKNTNALMLIRYPKEPIALVRWEDQDLPLWADKIEESLSIPLQHPLTEPPIFRRANGLCVVGMSSPTSVEDIARNAPVLTVGDLKQVGVIDLLTRYFRWETPVNPNGPGGGVRSIHCPRILASALLERSKTATSCRFPPLVAVTTCPTIRADHSIMQENGYDPETGLFLWSDIDLRENPLPENLTDGEIIKAMETLGEPYKDFPFASPADWGVAIAHVLTGVVRPLLHSAPMFVYTAPTMGSGKTLAATVASYIFSGSSPNLASWSRNVEEQSKVLFALLLGGETSVLLDNLNGELSSEPLCTILTENSYSGRRLGASEHVEVPTTCTWAVSGNNIVVRGDLTTRALVCRIDAKLERPEEREFERNLHTWVPENRAALVRAALIIIKGYLDRGRPEKDSLPTWGRFEGWSHWVRESLYWASKLSGIKAEDGTLGVDVYESTAGLHAADPDREERLALLTSLKFLFSDEFFTVSKLTRAFREPVNPLFADGVPGTPASHQKIESREAIEAMPESTEAEKHAKEHTLKEWDRAQALDWLREWACDTDPRGGHNISSKSVSTALLRHCNIPASGMSLLDLGVGGAGARKRFAISSVEG